MAEPQAPGGFDDHVREVLARFGMGDILDEALGAARLMHVPMQADALDHFIEHPLLEALTGHVHPATARTIADELHARLRELIGSGVRRKTGDETGVPTVPPPPLESGLRPYDDLASGAVHTRATPVWGLRRTTEHGDAVGGVVWIVVSHDPELCRLVQATAAPAADVTIAEDVAALKAALERSHHPASCIVVDAQRPSVPIDRAIAALLEGAVSARVVLWRMDHAAHALLVDAVPVARTWLACESEVTPAEIVQLLGA